MATRGSLIFINVKAARSRSDGHGNARSLSHLVKRGAFRCVRSSSDGRSRVKRGSWPEIVGVTWTHKRRRILIGRRSRKEIVGHDSHDLARSNGHESTPFWLTVETCGSFRSVGSSSNRRRSWRSLIARSDRPPYLIRSDGSDQLSHDRGSRSRFKRGPIAPRSD